MGMNYKDLPYKHKEECTNRDSKDIDKRDIQYDVDFICSYEAYCPVCENHLYTFEYGHIEMY